MDCQIELVPNCKFGESPLAAVGPKPLEPGTLTVSGVQTLVIVKIPYPKVKTKDGFVKTKFDDDTILYQEMVFLTRGSITNSRMEYYMYKIKDTYERATAEWYFRHLPVTTLIRPLPPQWVLLRIKPEVTVQIQTVRVPLATGVAIMQTSFVPAGETATTALSDVPEINCLPENQLQRITSLLQKPFGCANALLPQSKGYEVMATKRGSISSWGQARTTLSIQKPNSTVPVDPVDTPFHENSEVNQHPTDPSTSGPIERKTLYGLFSQGQDSLEIVSKPPWVVESGTAANNALGAKEQLS